ncbi:carboxylesterase/lipase family protein [Congregibacter litoralis]|uniref:Carboxylic ester hydrolase n=1 Tax=Congregibacter litoralis KT71 TaxID=314285 RepID=A4ADB9_9GAMM|nr:carboxylesterase family protein [Congregibacter litoralis]EAQ96043.1 Carboxylesterase type B [Congregibacter litoralis KT71]
MRILRPGRSLLPALCCGLFLGCSAPPAQELADTLIFTESGQVVGVSSEHPVVRWRDIPYARPPVAELRWRAPQPLVGAAQERIAPSESDILCPQEPGEISGTDDDGFVGQEDCLYLDIVAPEDYTRKAYPVMFWIHGGGNTSGHKGTYDYSALAARENVVVVTINYRLGPLGWFTHPALEKSAAGYDRSGNFGTLDIIAALEWTQRNIAAFGGDPDNVTIFGESAGGRNVYSMLASPLAEGLFHKAIAQSPTAQSYSPEQAYNADQQFSNLDRGSWEVLKELGKDNDRVGAEELRGLSVQTLLGAYYGIDKDHAEPLIVNDGEVIPEEGLLAALANPAYAKHVPVMAGSNRDEVTLWLGLNRYFVDADDVLFGVLPPKLRVREPDLFGYWVEQRGRGWKVRSVDRALTNLEAAGYSDLYAYRFDWDEQADNWFVPFSQVLGAAHASEIAFVMGAPMYGSVGEYMYPDTDSAGAMTEIMMSAWAQFARSGKPGSVADTSWPVFTAAQPDVMVLDAGADSVKVLRDSPGLDGLLTEIAETASPLSDLETCMLVWELVTTVGDAAYDEYRQWNNGSCASVDVPEEKAAVRAALTEKYGSPDVL